MGSVFADDDLGDRTGLREVDLALRMARNKAETGNQDDLVRGRWRPPGRSGPGLRELRRLAPNQAQKSRAGGFGFAARMVVCDMALHGFGDY